MSLLRLLLVVGCSSIVWAGCATSQTQMVGLLKESQKELKTCQSDLLASERTRSEIELEKLKLERQKQSESQVARVEPVSSPSHIQPHLIHEVTLPQLTRMAEAAGASVRTVGPRLVATFGRLKTFLIYNPSDHVLTAHARFTGFEGGLDVVNEWNRTKRFSRAYMDEDKDLVLEAELDVEYGVSPESVRSWIKGFGIVLNVFHRSLAPAAGGGDSTSPERHSI